MHTHFKPGIVIVFVLALVLASPLMAQRRKGNTPKQKESEPQVVQQLKREFATLALDFWTTRLNEYKQQIDRTLSPADLGELNRARVFVALFVEQKQWNELGGEVKETFEGGDSYEERAIDTPYEEGSIDSSNMESFTPKSKEESAEAAARLVDRVSEIAENLFLAKRFARRYRPQLGNMREKLASDLRMFVDTMMAFKTRFAAAHRAEIDRVKDLRDGFNELDRAKLDEAIEEITTGKELGMISDFVIEPLVFLYNGQDIMQIIKENDLLPEELGDLSAEFPSVLQGSSVNASGNSTAVTYRLPEASRATTLRLYNAAGELVGTYDQGPRSAGTNSVQLDLGSLPSGTYLYSLSVTDSRGNRVYSRAMQVAK